MTYTFRFDAVTNNLPFLLEGLYLTLLISGLALVFSMVLGVFVALGRLSRSRVISFASATYIEVFRDTPVLVQLFWVYYVLPILLGIRIDALTAAILGLTLHSTAFLGEIYRAGIQTVPRGHTEAAKVLGLSPRDAFVRIVLPQAIRNVLPDLVSNTVEVVKLTSIASVVALPEMLYSADMARSITFNASPIVLAAAIYLVMLWPVVRLISRLERRMAS
jgi:polar amino acid transport system permease protein